MIVDHGAGNLPSVERALRFLGDDPVVTEDPARVRTADRVVLPGVGAFGDCADAIRARGFDEALGEVRRAGRPILGICVGLQVLFDESDEFGPVAGLGWLGGRVERLQLRPGLKVPHMGWDQVRWRTHHPVFADAAPPDAAPWFYFVHSYAARPADERVIAGEVVLSANGSAAEERIVAAVARDNVIAVQFHPEKSARSGLALLGGFLRWQP